MPDSAPTADRLQRTAKSPEAGRATIEGAVRIAIDAFAEMGLRGERIVVIGGGQLSERSALALGADVYCPKASAASKAAATFRAMRSPVSGRRSI